MDRRARILSASVAVVVVLSVVVASQPTVHMGPGLADAVARGSAEASAVPSETPGPTASPPSPGSSPAGATSAPADPSGALPADEAVAQLQAAGASLAADQSGHVVGVVAKRGGTLPSEQGTEGFVRTYAAAFGVKPGSALRPVTTDAVGGGDTVTRYQQEVDGVPVMGGEILVTANEQGQVLAANAAASSLVPVGTSASVSSGAALATAVAKTAELSGRAPTDLTGTAKLWLYEPRLMSAPGPDGLRPTWLAKVSDLSGMAVSTVLVDGLTGAVTLALTAEESANRIVCDRDNTALLSSDLDSYACNSFSASGRAATTRREGGPPSGVDEVNKAYDDLGAAQNFYSTNFGLNSYDGRGTQIKATVRACVSGSVCPYPNAFWNGYQLVFGDGFVTDDVVGHEYTHAVTNYSSQLFYAYQAGAINEALSDIMGEFIDQSFTASGEDTSKLWLIGEDLPPDPNTGVHELRDMANPERLGQPTSVLGTWWASFPPTDPRFDNGGVHTNSGVANYAAYLIATGIGVPKSKLLWYRVMHTLASGADYPALGVALLSACDALVNHGLAAGDCVTVSNAVQTTMMIGINAGAGESVDCGLARHPDTPIAFDDFESRSGWTLTAGIWEYIPAPDVPVRYAYSGTTALYGFATAGQVGVAELNTPFTVTRSSVFAEGPFLFAQAVSFGSGQLQFEYNAGAGWLALGSPVTASNAGYHTIGVDLSGLLGQTIRIRIKVAATSTTSEWLVDDVRANGCLNMNVLYEPHYFSGNIVGNTGTVSWTAWTGPGDRFEISYDPPVPGAPTIVNATNDAPAHLESFSMTVPGVDPGRTYRLTIVQVFSLSNGGRSRPYQFTLSANAPLNCPSTPPQFLTIWTPPRTPTTPSNACDVVAPPRRSG